MQYLAPLRRLYCLHRLRLHRLHRPHRPPPSGGGLTSQKCSWFCRFTGRSVSMASEVCLLPPAGCVKRNDVNVTSSTGLINLLLSYKRSPPCLKGEGVAVAPNGTMREARDQSARGIKWKGVQESARKLDDLQVAPRRGGSRAGRGGQGRNQYWGSKQRMLHTETFKNVAVPYS